MTGKGLRKWLAPFGLDKRYKMPSRTPVETLKVMEITQRTIDKIDRMFGEIPDKDAKVRFLEDLYYNLGAIMCGLACEKMILEGKVEIDEGPTFLKKLMPLQLKLFDHMRCYNKEEATFHPYKGEISEFEKLIVACKQLGLTFNITGDSEYFPGHTFKLTIKKVDRIS